MLASYYQVGKRSHELQRFRNRQEQPQFRIFCCCLYICKLSFHLFFSTTAYILYYFYQFWVYSIEVTQSYTLLSDPPNISSTHLASYIVIPLLLTLLPMLYFITLWLFFNYQFVPLPHIPSWQSSVCSLICIQNSELWETICSAFLGKLPLSRGFCQKSNYLGTNAIP